ncbi:MAG: glycoside hydrolase family 31 protein [Kofleriaceae bacterium]
MKRLGLLLGFAACGDNGALTVVPVTSGPSTVTLVDAELHFTRGSQTLLTFTPQSFEIGTVDDVNSGDSFDPYWLYQDSPIEPAGLVWHTPDHFKMLRSNPTELDFEADAAEVSIQIANGGDFTIHVTTDTAGAAYIRVRPDADSKEAFYGLGEWGDSVNSRGKLRPMQMEGDFIAEGADNEDHVPVPLVIGTRGWGLFAQSDHAGVFDVARQNDTRIDVVYGTTDLKLHLFSAAVPMDVLAEYFQVTGYPGIPAPWAYGPLLWRNGNADQAQVIDDIAQIRTRHLATTGIWFDRPYASGVETFDFDPAKFPDPKTMLGALHDAGLRYGVWQTPYTAPAGEQDPAPDQYAYATSHNFFPPTTGVLVNPWGKPIDFTNDDAYSWWAGNLETYTNDLDANGYGVEGFKLDYGEDVVVGLNGQRTPWQFKDGTDERTMHRGYTLLYHQIYRERLAHEGAFLLTRTGRWGDQTKGMIIWPGDLDASFAKAGDPMGNQTAVGGLPAAVIKGMTLATSGFPFYASDTGGYRHSPATVETWLRWVEANTIASAMEVGDASSQQPWEFTADNGRDQHALDVYAQYALLHLRLYPYAWTLAQQIHTTGRPALRPLGFAAPELGVHPDDEYLFGENLLVAPIVSAGTTSRMVQFPAGDWYDWWTGTKITGPVVKQIDAPLEQLPLFVKGVVPMLRPSIDTLSPTTTPATIDSFATDPGVLWVRVGGPATVDVYDGTRIIVDSGFEIDGGAVFTEGAMFEILGKPMPNGVVIGGTSTAMAASLVALEAATSGWFFASGTLYIKTENRQRATLN